MNQDTQLYRQIRKTNVANDGRVTSLAFRPMPKDKSMLSVYDGDKITPEGAFLHFTGDLRGDSVGILATIVAECKAEALSVYEDYDTHPYHVLIDFSGKSNNMYRRIAEHLRDAAVKRGWLVKK